MISVIVYGRNDSYGYNLAKRAAISLNCIAQVLDDRDDEIIFVDCNTPNDIPTFPESIADTLTPRAKNLLRILRLRPEQYERGKNGSRFKVLEPLCRNVAIRRSNPANRWILNTNTDMVFTPLEDGVSLSRLVSVLPDGFYELPRFEMPESLWESTDRMDPTGTIMSFKRWGLRLHINEIVTASQEILFDGPGDFQLALRSQLFHVHGMNEQMVQGWHVDSNLCKRLWLLNGETKTVLDKVYAFHCDHTRIHTVYHVAGKSASNSFYDFFLNVNTPYVPEQADSWGMPGEHVEELSVDEVYTSRIQNCLEKILPGMDKPIANLFIACNMLDVSMYYDNFHVFPYLADIIANVSPYSTVGYVGNNTTLLGMLADFRKGIGHTGPMIYHCELFQTAAAGATAWLPLNCHPATRDQLYENADIVVFDFSMHNFPSRVNANGLMIPAKCGAVAYFAQRLFLEIKESAWREKDRSKEGRLLRPFIFVGCHSTSFDPIVQALFSCAMTPMSTYVRNGTLSADAFDTPVPIMPIHFYVIGATPQDSAEWISTRLSKPVKAEEVAIANDLYIQFIVEKDRQKALNALETLLSFDAGRGLLQMQMDIAEINGVPEQADSLRRFIEEYEKRPYHNNCTGSIAQ